MKISVRYLKLISFLLITIPFYPFFLGWMKPWIGVILSLILISGTYFYVKKQINNQAIFEISVANLLFLTIGVFLFVALSGAGGFGQQVADYYKQNAVTRDLITQNWPVSYQSKGETVYLAHYLGYYILMPAVFGGLGWKWVNLLNFFFTYSVIFIAVVWFFRVAKNSRKEWILFLLFFSGISIFSFIGLNGLESLVVLKEKIKNESHFFWLNAWNTIPLNFSGSFEQLRWSPQHTVPAWLLIGLMLNDWLVDDDVSYTPFYLSTLVLWSPLVMVGFAPYLLLVVVQKGFKSILNVTNFVVAPIIFVVTATFILSIDAGSFPKHQIFAYQNEIGNGLGRKIVVYLYFLIFEVAIWFVPTYFILKNKLNKTEKQVLILCGFLLCTIPLYRYGLWNDWCGRVTMPSLIILLVFVWRAFGAATSRWRGLLLGLLVLSAYAPLAQMMSSFRFMGYSIKFQPRPFQQVPDLPTVCVGYSLDQFVAKENTFFYKYIAKKKVLNNRF